MFLKSDAETREYTLEAKHYRTSPLSIRRWLRNDHFLRIGGWSTTYAHTFYTREDFDKTTKCGAEQNSTEETAKETPRAPPNHSARSPQGPPADQCSSGLSDAITKMFHFSLFFLSWCPSASSVASEFPWRRLRFRCSPQPILFSMFDFAVNKLVLPLRRKMVLSLLLKRTKKNIKIN